TKRRDVKSIVTQSLRREFIERRRSDGTAECRWITESCVINQHEQNVRSIRWSFHWLDKSRFGSLQRTIRDALEWLGWTRQHRSIPLRIRSERSRYLSSGRKCDRNKKYSFAHNALRHAVYSQATRLVKKGILSAILRIDFDSSVEWPMH